MDLHALIKSSARLAADAGTLEQSPLDYLSAKLDPRRTNFNALGTAAADQYLASPSESALIQAKREELKARCDAASSDALG